MSQYIVRFEFRNECGEWVETDLSNNGNGWTIKDAKDIAYQLRQQGKHNVRIEEKDNYDNLYIVEVK